jgi:hypothetical protein
MKKHQILFKLSQCTVVLGVLTFTGCASRSTVPAPPININPEYSCKMINSLDSTGFQLAAMDYNEILKYNKMILNVQMSDQLVEPGSFDGVKTGYLFYNDQDIVNEVVPVAQDSFNNALSQSTYFKSTTQPGINTLRANIYITEIVINDAVLGTLANIPAPTWIITKPLGMGIQYISDKGGGAVAIEIVVSDSATNRVVAVFGSREKGVFAGLINTERFSITESIDRIINDWAIDFISTFDQIKTGSKNTTAPKIAPLIRWVY